MTHYTAQLHLARTENVLAHIFSLDMLLGEPQLHPHTEGKCKVSHDLYCQALGHEVVVRDVHGQHLLGGPLHAPHFTQISAHVGDRVHREHDRVDHVVECEQTALYPLVLIRL